MTTDLSQNFGILGKNIHRKYMNNNRILVLGSNGMLGKMVSIYLSSNRDFDVTITARNTSQFIEDNFSGNYLKFDVVNDNLDKVIKKQDQ